MRSTFQTILFLLLFALVFHTSAAHLATPQENDILLTQLKDGSGTKCVMSFMDTAFILKFSDNDFVLLKTKSGCRGWAKKGNLKFIAKLSSIEEIETSCILDTKPADANTLYNFRKSLADSIAIYYGDSTLYSYLDSTKYFHHPDDSKFTLRFDTIKDSLYRYYMEHPRLPLEHEQFLTKMFGINRNNLFFARMEWDSLATFFSLNPDSVFDTVYATNRNLITIPYMENFWELIYFLEDSHQ